MKSGSYPESDPTVSSAPRRWGFPWLKSLAATGGLLLVGGGVLGVWGWQVLRTQLPAFLEENLSEALGRPLRLGEFERFSPTGMRFGRSILPPTAENFTWAKAEAVDISFDPLQLVFQRTLRPRVIFLSPEVAIKQGFNQEWAIQAPKSAEKKGLIKTELEQIQVRNATLAIGPVARRSIIPAPKGVVSSALIVLENVNVRVGFSGENNQTASFTVGGRVMKGAFQLKGQGRLDSGETNLSLAGQQLPIAALNPLLGGTLFVKDGLFTCNLDAVVRPDSESDPVALQGTARLRNGEILISELPSALSDINGTMTLEGQTGTLESSSLKYGPILVNAKGTVDPDAGYDMVVAIPQVSVAEVEQAFAQPLPIEAQGRFQVNTVISGPLLNPQVQGDLANLDVVQVDRLGIDAIAARFSANKTDFSLDGLTVRPATGGLVTAQGRVDFSRDLRHPDLDFTAQTDVPLEPLAALYQVPIPGDLRLGSLLADARVVGQPDRVQANAQWSLPQATFPGQGRLAFAGTLLQVRDTHFQVGGGHLSASADVNLNTQAWQGSVNGSGLPLAQVSPQLRGTLDADLRADGRLTALTLAATHASGQVRLSETIPLALNGAERLMAGPLQADFVWRGDRLEVPQATAPNLYASVALPDRGLPQLTGFDFDARLSSFNLGAAYHLLPAPAWVDLTGFVDFDGNLRGTLQDPQIAGRLGLRQFAVNDLALLSRVAGPVWASLRHGAQVDLRGDGRTAILADIAPDLRPNRFRLANGEFVAEGSRVGDLLNASVRNFDLAWLRLRPLANPDLGTVVGLLNANAQVNLRDLVDPQGVARVAIATPGVGSLTADSFTGRFQYGHRAARLTEGLLKLTGATEFQVAAQGRLDPEWQASAQVTTQNAQFQDILQALRLYRFRDFSTLLAAKPAGRAADLQTAAVGDPAAALVAQAQLAQAIRTQQAARTAQRQRALIPDLDQLAGSVSGRLTVAASQRRGLSGAFDFAGQDWAWGHYDFDNQFVARGRLARNVLTLDPIEFRARETRLSLTGQVSPQGPDLWFRAEQLPLNAIAELAATPIEVLGQLNLEAQLSGSFGNPELRGQLAVAQAQINHQPLEEISSTFGYQDAYFTVDGRVRGSVPEPLIFSGTLPLGLPFLDTQPASDQIALRATLKNEGFSLVNLLTPAVTWDGGNALMDLAVGGTLHQPLINGVVAFDQAAFNSPFLKTALTHLTGELRFTGERLQTDLLQGTLMEGSFALQGSLPLLRQHHQAGDGLVLALNDLNFNYADEIKSQVNGQMTFTQAVLNPVIGGEVLLQNTQVRVGPELRRLANAALVNPGIGSLSAALKTVPVSFDHLRLGVDTATVIAPPLFALNLGGDVAMSGPVSQPYGEGTITLTDGWVNTVTTEFFLERGRVNQAVFRPELGLDPDLDLEFSATVPLQRQTNLQHPVQVGNTAEIPDLDPLASTTVFDELTVHAQVKGPASHLFENLILSSNPARSQSELLSMASGGYLSDLGGIEPSLVLASNLLAAFAAETEDEIARALGLRYIRLTASTVLPSEAGDTLGYGVGLSLGISQNLSTTLVQVLNQSQPVQFNMRYRIDDQWGVRGSTNFGNQHRVFVEYRVDMP